MGKGNGDCILRHAKVAYHWPGQNPGPQPFSLLQNGTPFYPRIDHETLWTGGDRDEPTAWYLRFNGRNTSLLTSEPVNEDTELPLAETYPNPSQTRFQISIDSPDAEGFTFEHPARGGIYLPPTQSVTVRLVGPTGAVRLDDGGELPADPDEPSVGVDRVSLTAYEVGSFQDFERAGHWRGQVRPFASVLNEPRSVYRIKSRDTMRVDLTDDEGPWYLFPPNTICWSAWLTRVQGGGPVDAREVTYAGPSIPRRGYAQTVDLLTPTGQRHAEGVLGLQFFGQSGIVDITVETETWL